MHRENKDTIGAEMMNYNNELPSDAVASLESGNKIEAIKIVRENSGLGLKESKELVEKYLREHPDLHQRYSAIQSEQNKGAFMKLLFLLAVAAFVAYIFSMTD
jgi:hypothetical protein